MTNINIINWTKMINLFEDKYYYRSYAVLEKTCKLYEAEIKIMDNGKYGCNCFDNGHRFTCFEENDLDKAMMMCDSYILEEIFN